MSTFAGLLSGGRGPAFDAYDDYGEDAEWSFNGLGTTAIVVHGGKKKGKKKTKGKKGLRVRGGLRNQPLDETHYPFKRSSIRPGGPSGRADEEGRKWECVWADKYKQVCQSTKKGPKGFRRKTIKVNPEYKREYNKKYRQHMKEIGSPKFSNKHRFDYPDYTTESHAPKRVRKPRKSRAKKKTTA